MVSMKEQAQKRFRKPGRQGATSGRSLTTREPFISQFCGRFFPTQEFLRNFAGDRIPSVESPELVSSKREVSYVTWMKERKGNSSRQTLSQKLFDELNSDKLPRSDAIHPVNFKKLEVTALEYMSKMDSLS